MKIYYLAYDIDINTERMEIYFPTAKIYKLCAINNCRLKFCCYYEKAYPSIEKCEGKSVPVVIWELDEENMELLDIMHDMDRCYEKVKIKISGESEIQIFTYVMKNNVLGLPTEAYLGKMLDGYEEHDFDPTAIEEALDESLKYYSRM